MGFGFSKHRGRTTWSLHRGAERPEQVVAAVGDVNALGEHDLLVLWNRVKADSPGLVDVDGETARLSVLLRLVTQWRPAAMDGMCVVTGVPLDAEDLVVAVHPGGFDVVAAHFAPIGSY